VGAELQTAEVLPFWVFFFAFFRVFRGWHLLRRTGQSKEAFRGVFPMDTMAAAARGSEGVLNVE
jgi:hypothetical protein